MSRWKRLRRALVRLFPPVLLCLAVATPAAQAQRVAPTPMQAHHCADIAADHWLHQLPAPDLITRVASGAAFRTQVLKYDRIYEVIWREFNIAGDYRWAWRWVRAWTEDGHIGCTWQGSTIHTASGHSPYNPPYLG
jgi:hypothetical protein